MLKVKADSSEPGALAAASLVAPGSPPSLCPRCFVRVFRRYSRALVLQEWQELWSLERRGNSIIRHRCMRSRNGESLARFLDTVFETVIEHDWTECISITGSP